MYDLPVDDVTGFILAGGKSTRMGADKAFLQFEGQTLLERALAVAGTVASHVRIVGAPNRFAAYGQVIEDIYPERGPLGGIHAALRNTTTEFNVVLAVDLPFMQAGFLSYLIAQARQTGAIVTVANAGGGLQPLCAVYRREFAAVAERSLQQGRNKIDALFALVKTRTIEEKDLAALHLPENMFQNLNSAEEWEAATRQKRPQ